MSLGLRNNKMGHLESGSYIQQMERIAFLYKQPLTKPINDLTQAPKEILWVII